MGDVVRGPLQGQYPSAIETGIRLHRSIDSYTDAHPVVRAAKARFNPPYRRYAGILLDVYFDHCLTQDWGLYHSQSLETFVAHAHDRLMTEALHLRHPGFALRLSYMRSRNLLLSYREHAGVAYALKGLSGRLKRDNPLADGLSTLQAQEETLKADFRAFYPDLMRHGRTISEKLAA